MATPVLGGWGPATYPATPTPTQEPQEETRGWETSPFEETSTRVADLPAPASTCGMALGYLWNASAARPSSDETHARGGWSTNPCAHLSSRPVEEVDQRLRVHAEESFRLEALGGTIGWDRRHGHREALGVNSTRTERRAHGKRQRGVRGVIEV